MKKTIILLILLIMFTSTKPIGTFAENDRFVRVVYNQISIFNLPNASGEETTIIGNVKYGDRLTLNDSSAIIGDDNFYYYSVSFNNINGYVFSSQVVLDENKSLKRELDYNATVKEDCDVYDNVDQEPVYSLKSGTKIQILDGYDSSKVYTKVQYLDDEENNKIGYIKTSLISVSGISRGTVGAIVIIVATITIILISFGVIGRRKKSKLGK